MELRDYLRMLGRGWLTVVVAVVLAVMVGSLYLAVTPKRYEASTSLYVSANAPATIGDLGEGASFAEGAVATYAELIKSALVLERVAAQLDPPGDVDEVAYAVSTSVPTGTTLIDIVASGTDPERVTDIANTVAAEAGRVLPELGRAASGRPLVQVQQTQPAATPTTPVSPDTERTLALAFIVGLCIGLALTVTRQVMYPRVFTPEDVGDLTDVPLLGSVSQRRKALARMQADDVPIGAAGDSYRTLRTNLRILELRNPRCLLVTSVIDDRSGAQVAANLAWSLALAGNSVLLVDMDLRHSAVGEAFGMPADLGFADVVTGRADLPDVVRHTDNPRLRIVLAGTAQADPSDLLSGSTVNTVLRQLEQQHDFVILHAPPVLAYTDAAVVSSLARGTLVTMASRRTRAKDLTSALSALAKVRIRPVGLVLTGTAPRKSTSVIEDGLNRPPTPAEPDAAQIEPPWSVLQVDDDVLEGLPERDLLPGARPVKQVEAPSTVDAWPVREVDPVDAVNAAQKTAFLSPARPRSREPKPREQVGSVPDDVANAAEKTAFLAPARPQSREPKPRDRVVPDDEAADAQEGTTAFPLVRPVKQVADDEQPDRTPQLTNAAAQNGAAQNGATRRPESRPRPSPRPRSA